MRNYTLLMLLVFLSSFYSVSHADAELDNILNPPNTKPIVKPKPKKIIKKTIHIKPKDEELNEIKNNDRDDEHRKWLNSIISVGTRCESVLQELNNYQEYATDAKELMQTPYSVSLKEAVSGFYLDDVLNEYPSLIVPTSHRSVFDESRLYQEFKIKEEKLVKDFDNCILEYHSIFERVFRRLMMK